MPVTVKSVNGDTLKTNINFANRPGARCLTLTTSHPTGDSTFEAIADIDSTTDANKAALRDGIDTLLQVYYTATGK